jgi:signal transduction histidine kinase/CHASE1-domain containing sensor protein/ActR/RegA family two-component response regulator
LKDTIDFPPLRGGAADVTNAPSHVQTPPPAIAPASNRGTQANRWGKLGAYLALSLGLVVTAFVWNLERTRAGAERAAVIAERANYLAARIRQRLVAYELALRGGASLFATSQPSREQWRAYVDALDLDSAHPGLRGVGFSVWLEPAQVSALEGEVRAEGLVEFQVWPHDSASELSAILYLEPRDPGNQRALGFNMYADAVRRAAMAAARDSGKPAMTSEVLLVQDEGGLPKPGVLLYVPVYRYGEPIGAVEERRRAFVGWVYSPFRPTDLMASISLDRPRLLAIRLYDGQAEQGNGLLYESSPERFSPEGQRKALRVPIEFAGRTWTLEAQPAATELAAQAFGYRSHWVLMVGGVLISLMLFFLVRSLATTRDRAYALAETMTEALRRTNAELDERVHARTEELLVANAQLREQIAERELAERERSMAFAQQAERNAQLRALAQASVAIGRLPDTAARLDYLADEACRLLGCERSVVVPAGESGGSDSTSRDHDAVGEASGRSANQLVVPVRVMGGRELGTLHLSRGEDRPFTTEDRAIARQLMLMAAAAIALAEAAEDERRARLDAEAANTLKDRFLAIVSHELRSPLHAILGWLGVIERRHDNLAHLDRALAVIRRNAEAQSALIDDLLDLARIEQGKLQIEHQPLEIAEIVTAVVESQRQAASARDITLVAELEPPGLVAGDRLRLQQVLVNLVGNALKFTPAEGQVTVKLKREGREAVLEVADNGQGIDHPLLEAIFDQFRQADSSSSRRHGGLGLGLALVRHIVQLHGGEVEAFSEGPGKGSRFVVRLPLSELSEKSGDAADGRAPARYRWPAGGDRGQPEHAQFAVRSPSVVSLGQPGQGAGEGRRGPRPAARTGAMVLVVDDHADAREAAAACLIEEGFEVKASASVGEALDWLAERETACWPTAVLCDIEMPGRDGYEFVAGVRELERKRRHEESLPVIAVTAYSSPEDRARTMRSGFLAHFGKPLRIERVLGLLTSLAR